MYKNLVINKSKMFIWIFYLIIWMLSPKVGIHYICKCKHSNTPYLCTYATDLHFTYSGDLHILLIDVCGLKSRTYGEDTHERTRLKSWIIYVGRQRSGAHSGATLMHFIYVTSFVNLFNWSFMTGRFRSLESDIGNWISSLGFNRVDSAGALILLDTFFSSRRRWLNRRFAL